MERSYLINCFHFVGVHPKRSVSLVRICIISLLIIYLTSMATLKLYFCGALQMVESITLYIHVATKYGALIFYRTAIADIITDAKDFWDTNVTDEKVIFLRSYIKRINQVFVISSISAATSFGVKPLILNNSSVFDGYRPPHIPFALYVFWEYLFEISGLTIYLSFNLMICRLITTVAIQFRLLNLEIMKLDFDLASQSRQGLEKCRNDLKRVVKYHLFLLRHVQKLALVLSASLAVNISVIVCLLCINMYISSLQDASSFDRNRVITTSCIFVFEFFLMYGLPTQVLMNEAEDISNVIYTECKWYLPNTVPLRKYLIMMMIRSQRGVSIRAGNYHAINNQTVVLMLKTAYSFYTFIQTLT